MNAEHASGEIIGDRFRIVSILGQGGNGITYKAECLNTGQLVALKALSLRQMPDWKPLELFEREARILQQLDHPRIPRYLDYFYVDTPENRAFYIVQELVEGQSLAVRVEKGWRTNEAGVRNLAAQVLEILIYLQRFNPPVIHRDIKPQNLIVGKDNQLFLVDFGAVRDTYTSTLGRGSTVVGTFGYMAPEQFMGQATPATDLYGLGATLLFVLTHRSPAELPEERLKISFRSRVKVSESFADWLEKMIAPDVGDRFLSAREALDGLRGTTSGFNPLPSSNIWKVVVTLSLAAVVVFKFFKYPFLKTFGLTPEIHIAVELNDFDTVGSFLRMGGQTNYGRFTPTDLMFSVNSEKMLRFLLDRGADVNAKRSYDDPILMSVLKRDSPELESMVDLLLEKGVDVNEGVVYEMDTKTPLSTAVYTGNIRVVEKLIAKGADVQKGQTYGASYSLNSESHTMTPTRVVAISPLDVARAAGNRKMVEILQRHGAIDTKLCRSSPNPSSADLKQIAVSSEFHKLQETYVFIYCDFPGSHVPSGLRDWVKKEY